MNHLFPRTSTYFAKQIKLIRLHLAMSYIQFGEMVDLTPLTVSRIENEIKSGLPSKRTWNKINLALMRIKYFERNDIPKMEIPNHIVYAIDDMKNKQTQKTAINEYPCYLITPVTHPSVRTFWQPSRKPNHQQHSTT